ESRHGIHPDARMALSRGKARSRPARERDRQPMIELETPRLRLRQWRDADREPFAALNSDPVTMEFFPGTLAREASDAMVDGFRRQLEERGWSNWAVEVRETGDFIGFVGLSIPKRTYSFSPCVEIGWRVARRFWGLGYA